MKEAHLREIENVRFTFPLLTFFHPVLEKLSGGNVIRTSIAFALRVVAALTVLGGIVLLFLMLKEVFRFETAGQTIGGLLFAVVLAATFLAIYQILMYRARNVQALGESPFTVIPIFSVLFRILGETYAVLGLAIGAGGCLFIWFAQFNPMFLLGSLGSFFPSVSPEGTFVGGLLFALYMSVASFVVLLLFYFIAEASLVLADIARSLRLLVRQSGMTSN
jgi:hypothetical protein